MSIDPAIRDHQAWLGYLQPDGLVVSPAALVDLQVILPRDTLPLQERFLEFVEDAPLRDDETSPAIADFAAFAQGFLGWPDDCLYGVAPGCPVPDALRVVLSEFGETLEPSLAFADPQPKNPDNPWLLLIQILPCGTQMDTVVSHDARGWAATPARRFERLLRETKVPIGLMTNGIAFRLMYAPRGENAGSITFPVSAMAEVAGRPILAAFDLLLKKTRLLTGPVEARLPGLLAKSREYQSSVSTKLAEQVLDALYEFLRGFQSANERTKGELLRQVLVDNPDDIYAGLLTVLMRLVFLLYAEDRGLMPGSSLYVRNYSVHGLFEKLRADNEHYPDTMDHRYGAWPQLLALFRAVHDGSRHQQLAMTRRRGYLFDPTRFPFLMGTSNPDGSSGEGRVPLVADGVIFRVLHKLMVLDGERLSYRTLDVEQIGSVYETMMGFCLKIAEGQSVALKPAKRHGAPAIVNLNELLAVKGKERTKWLAERTDSKFSGEAVRGIESATSIDALLAAIERKIARNATPHVVPIGAMTLQPSDERRRSGSHYTPRSLTEPIVRTTLRPVLQQMGDRPTPEQILALKVCDIAVGSGAFLVETCRQLGDELVKAWHTHNRLPNIPHDEDEVLYARRLVAQRCLYGVDRNAMAADLAKLSLWLVTLAKDHPFTFLDHALRCGDSVVGLTRRQIVGFNWRETPHRVLGQDIIENRINTAMKSRKELLEADDDFVSPELKRQKLDLADASLNMVREAGDLVIAAFFGADKEKDRQSLRDVLLGKFIESFHQPLLNLELDGIRCELRGGERPVTPFHWEIEFPEVFDRENPGFDAIVGNPPFAGKNNVINGNRAGYIDWLKIQHSESHGNADLVAHFFRRAHDALRCNGTFGLIATNTIGQGDTRTTGLRWLCTHGGTIYAARKRVKWPGQAAVVVSVVHAAKGLITGPYELDGRQVPTISAYLFHAGGHENPATLQANAGKSFIGSYVLGMGFTFDDTDTKGVANPICMMHELIAKDPRNAERIFPFIGGEEVNDSPTHQHHRFVINFGEMTEDEARSWPDLMRIVEEKVKPSRLAQNRELRSRYWWRFGETTPALFRALQGKESVFVNSLVSSYLCFALMPSATVFSHALGVYPIQGFHSLAVIQSRIHEQWALFQASSLEERLRYNPSDCFETFPFPPINESNRTMEKIGRDYYEFRATLMVRNNEGLTKTYNRFHSPEESDNDILRLRELHTAMDKAVLDAYGWDDIPTDCEFLLDYEDEEDDEESGRRRKKPWRYRWPDAVRDEVLARLLKLNAERAAEEKNAVVAEPAKVAKPTRKPKTDDMQGSLFGLTYPTIQQKVMVTPPDVFDPTNLPDGIWKRPLADQLAEIGSILAAVLKSVGGPTPALQVRLAVLLASEPRLLTPVLAGDEAITWRRLIGLEAEPHVNGVTPLVPRVNRALGRALGQLRGSGQLVENIAADTWAPGIGLDDYYTEGWPEGRAQMILSILSRHSFDEIVQQLPQDVQRWIYDKAA